MKNKLKRLMGSVLCVTVLFGAFGSIIISFAENGGEFDYELSEEGTAEITHYVGGGCEVDVPEAIDGHPVTGIAEYAFLQLTDVTKITVPKSVTKIGEYAFDECYSLAEIAVDENNAYYSSDDKGVLFNKEKTELIQYPLGSSEKEYVIPETVVKINPQAFLGCKNLESITISERVSNIDEYTFYETDSLSFINVRENNRKYSSDENGVLFNKDKSELLQYPPGKNSEEYTVPESVKTIGANAFRNCNNLVSVKIPDSVSVIKSFAFAESGGLKEITIPDGVKTIGNSAFYWCQSLESVIIPDTVTSIGTDAFAACESLSSVTIPESVISIAQGAFDRCNKLDTVYYTGSLEQWNNIEIGDANENLLNNIVYDYSQQSGLKEIIIIICLIIVIAAVIIALTVKKKKHKKPESKS